MPRPTHPPYLSMLLDAAGGIILHHKLQSTGNGDDLMCEDIQRLHGGDVAHVEDRLCEAHRSLCAEHIDHLLGGHRLWFKGVEGRLLDVVIIAAYCLTVTLERIDLLLQDFVARAPEEVTGIAILRHE